MNAKRIGGGVLLVSALIAGWLIVAPPGASDARVPAIVAGAAEQGSPDSHAKKKISAPASSRGIAAAAQPTAGAVTTPRPVTGGPRGYGYGVTDQSRQVIPPPRPTVMTEVRPGMPENETTGTERGHDRGPNFNLGLYRQADGSVYRP